MKVSTHLSIIRISLLVVLLLSAPRVGQSELFSYICTGRGTVYIIFGSSFHRPDVHGVRNLHSQTYGPAILHTMKGKYKESQLVPRLCLPRAMNPRQYLAIE